MRGDLTPDTPSGKWRPCSRCRYVFEITAKRRMLCYTCYKRGGISSSDAMKLG